MPKSGQVISMIATTPRGTSETAEAQEESWSER